MLGGGWSPCRMHGVCMLNIRAIDGAVCAGAVMFTAGAVITTTVTKIIATNQSSITVYVSIAVFFTMTSTNLITPISSMVMVCCCVFVDRIVCLRFIFVLLL